MTDFDQASHASTEDWGRSNVKQHPFSRTDVDDAQSQTWDRRTCRAASKSTRRKRKRTRLLSQTARRRWQPCTKYVAERLCAEQVAFSDAGFLRRNLHNSSEGNITATMMALISATTRMAWEVKFQEQNYDRIFFWLQDPPEGAPLRRTKRRHAGQTVKAASPATNRVAQRTIHRNQR